MAISSSSAQSQRVNENGNAFQEVAPPSVSSCSYGSSSSTLSKLRCDVFINHRGVDVKKTLAADIYDTLSRMGLQAFLDEKVLEPGDSITMEIQEAMESASLHIAILSKHYAESPWCLSELYFMLETKTRIIPIFYNVDPSKIRWVAYGKGIYAEAFRDYERGCRYTPEKIQEWKSAVERVSCISGYTLSNDDWGWLLESLENLVMKVMRKEPLVVSTGRLVGLEQTVKDFESKTLKPNSTGQNVEIVGIVGMGGCGKTTLAKEVYNRKCTSIHRSSFLHDVRDQASKSQLPKLQQKLLDDLGVKAPAFENIHEGMAILSDRLRSLHVLIVLDDVDHKDQMDALLPAKHSLGSDSLIIVTTRDLDVLTSAGISSSSIYKIRGLNPFNAKELFCWHAFLKSHPLQGFENLVEKFVNTCGGLPLSLKILGGQLCYKPRDYWESQLNELSRILPQGIAHTLKISYDALHEEEQMLFLDIACFFIGERKSLATEVWDGLGRSGMYIFETLRNKCLVELDHKSRIRMHDHLRDFGREIAKQKSPYRIWFEGQINNIQQQVKKGIQVQGIMAAKTYFHSNFHSDIITGKCLSHYRPPFKGCMEVMGSSWRRYRHPKPSPLTLKLLVIKDEYFNKNIGTLSKGLVWLRWFDFKHANLPSYLSLENLRVLELYNIERLDTLRENNANPPSQLRELIIQYSPDVALGNFQGFPRSIRSLKHLKRMVINFGGSSVRSLPEEFCDLLLLEHLELHGFKMLLSLPDHFGSLNNLRHVNLALCSSLKTLPVSFKQLTRLQHLDLSSCGQLRFTSENLDILENMAVLEYLNFSGCYKLEVLPHHITNQKSLKQLYLNDRVRNVPANIGQLSKLEEMSIGSPLSTSLPISLGDLSCLTTLLIIGCTKLKYLPDSLGHLNLLENLCIKNSGVESFPTTFVQLTNLRRLYISFCPLKELVFKSGSASSLHKLKEIVLEYTSVSTVSISEDCPNLETLDIISNEYLREIESLPTKLKELTLRECPELDKLPSFAYLTSLKNLDIEVPSKFGEVEGFEQLTSLETFRATSGWKVPGIQSLKQMEKLRAVVLSADNISAIEPCILSIKNWPSKLMICGRTVGDAKLVIDNFSFPNLTVVNSSAHEDRGISLKCPKMHSSDAVIVCFVIDCLHSSCSLTLEKGAHYGIHNSTLGSRLIEDKINSNLTMNFTKGKWLWIGICDSSTNKDYNLSSRFIFPEYRRPNYIIEKGILVVGAESRVRKVFNELLLHLKG